MKNHKCYSVIGFCFSLFTSTYFCPPSSGSSTKTAPLNINKVSSSLLSFGRKLIAPAISVSSSGVSPINSEVHSSSSSSSSTSPASAPPPALPEPLAEPPSGQAPPQTQNHGQSQHYRLLKSESMPVHLSKGERRDTHTQVQICSSADAANDQFVHFCWLSCNWWISCMYRLTPVTDKC